MEGSWWRKWKVVRKWNVIVWKGIFFSFFLSLGSTRLCFRPTGPDTLILPAYRSTMLTAWKFVTRDTVRHPRRFVFGKFVRKPNCSWSEAFVNRGLTVFHILRRGEGDIIITEYRPSCNVPVILVRFESNLIFFERNSKILKYRISWRSVRLEPNCCM